MTSIFSDKNTMPSVHDLTKVLGDTFFVWEALAGYTIKTYLKATEEWSYSGPKYGWNFIIKDKKRVLVYLLPRDGYFKAAFVFGQKATDVILLSDISDVIKKDIQNAKVYAEGRGIRIGVTNNSITEDLKKLISIKISSRTFLNLYPCIERYFKSFPSSTTMNNQNLSSSYRKIGQTTCCMVFVLGAFYAVITTIGLLTLESPQHSIGNPYFTIMEILSILIALLMSISLVAVHYYTASTDKFYSLTALILMFITTAITSCVHFLVLSLSYTAEARQIPNFSFFFSFRWPSMVYVLDILAWDFFFGLSMLFLVPVFKKTRLEKNLKTVLLVSGILSLIGLIGVPLQNMQIRNIGIIGYAVAGPVAFLLMGKIIGRPSPAQHYKVRG